MSHNSSITSERATATRRDMLATIAAGATVLATGTAQAAVAHPDARMTALGATLREQWMAYASNRPQYERLCNLANERLYQKLISTPSELDINDDAAWALHGQVDAEVGFPAVEKIDEETLERVGDITREIGKIEPKTLQDLAVLANAAAATNSHLWDCDPNELDWDKGCFRLLVDAVLKLAGSKLILEGLPTPQCVNTDGWYRAHKYWEQRNPEGEAARRAA